MLKFVLSWRGLWTFSAFPVFFLATTHASQRPDGFAVGLVGIITVCALLGSLGATLYVLINNVPMSRPHVGFEMACSITTTLFGGWWFGLLNTSLPPSMWHTSPTAIIPLLIFLAWGFSSIVQYRDYRESASSTSAIRRVA
jgi:hypothetical protein